jgi:hypothetical protein
MKSKNLILDATHIVYTKAANSGFLPSKVKSIGKELKVIMDFFAIDQTKAMVISMVIQESFIEGDVEIKRLAQYFGITPRQAYIVYECIEGLFQIGYIQKEERGFQTKKKKISLMGSVMEAVLKNDNTKLKPKTIADMASILSEFAKLQLLCKRGNLSTTQYIRQVERLCNNSAHIPAVQYLLSLQLPSEELVMFFYVANLTFQGRDLVEVNDVIREVTSDVAEYYEWCAKFRTQNTQLFKENLVELSFFELGLDTDISLTQIARERIFSNVDNLLKNYFKPSLSKLVTPSSIAPVELIYDASTVSRMEMLTKAVDDGNYNQLCTKLKERNLRGGLTILLHGYPGTGKTETVYQLARKSDRVILRLEISTIKNMWVGESEKNIKKVFQEYKQAKRVYDKHPILLFNEADAIFGKRRNVDSAVDQMENSLQNILLQELEEFDGILIATTNLTQNLDQAFERRFLYKVHFDIPSVESRYKLLSTAFNGINSVELYSIANAYSITGSMIENLKRKMTLAELTDNSYVATPDSIKQLLEGEGMTPTRRSIGFAYGG